MHGAPFFAKLVTFIVLTAAGNLWAEHWLEENSQSVTAPILYQSAGKITSAAQIPVSVLDISLLYEVSAQRGARPSRPLNKEEFGYILDLFKKSIESGSRPAGIGFDMDFSSSDNDLDRKLHKECIELARDFGAKTGIPVWLGVSEGIQPNRDAWLIPGHGHLAAAIVLQTDLTYQPLWYGPAGVKRENTLPTLGVALGRHLYEQSTVNIRNGSENLLTKRVRLVEEPNGPLFKLAQTNWDTVETFLVDYEPNRFRRDITHVFDASRARMGLPGLQEKFWKQFDGRAVFVGAAVDPDRLGDWIAWQAEASSASGTSKARPEVGNSVPNDTFQVHSQTGFPSSASSFGDNEILRGIYAHACAAYTYAARPLRKFDGLPALFFTTLLSLCAFCIHVGKDAGFKKEPKPTSQKKLLIALEKLSVRAGGFFVSLVCFPILIVALGSWIKRKRKGATDSTKPFEFGRIETHSQQWQNFETAIASIAYPSAAVMVALAFAQRGILWFGFVATILYVLGEALLEPLVTGLLTVVTSFFRGKDETHSNVAPS